ncbi:hypothetical protein TMatcc_007166 [Talaromyces marneffei ATCC 18224]|uniref:Uncharacterized protein n=1 Tax=Talaromyces marneffei (strain ATCC 18224 / CBS 334.59 / QM 7333) TaxID=441960 RepID=B6QF58_TALMQ|nr:uncharacterized protein EYB26_004148 [Talaromyces marneffei]EEA24093.1 conserved hypothetical protein [Talaromyces marneffei ATCC 18224]KAE8553390.1 hypothetical protein EYB25_004772 [Talaromyces marneffei]QGA16481.1 hypothetical protein EYB26_004148 [Talaromyces marneffei]
MPRGAEFDNGVPQSYNAIETGPNKAHGTNLGSDIDRSNKATAIPEVMGGNNLASGGGSTGPRASGSGKGGQGTGARGF